MDSFNPGFVDVGKLAEFVRSEKFLRIGVDGVNGSGKTTFAKELAENLGYRRFCLDDYLEKQRGGFVSQLNYSELGRDLDGKKSIVIEGVCLLEVLERLGFNIDCLVYVKRLLLGVWVDERECEIEGDVAQFIQKEKERMKLITRAAKAPDNLGLSEEIICYHASHKPHHKAKAIYCRNTG